MSIVTKHGLVITGRGLKWSEIEKEALRSMWKSLFYIGLSQLKLASTWSDVKFRLVWVDIFIEGEKLLECSEDGKTNWAAKDETDTLFFKWCASGQNIFPFTQLKQGYLTRKSGNDESA